MINDIEQAFGIKLKISEDKIKGIPVYMSSGRSFYKVTCDGFEFYIIELSDNEKFGIVAFEKQLQKYQDATKTDVAFYFSELTKVQRDALIGRKIPFVSGNNQMYFPFLGMLISNNFKKKQQVKCDKMMPATQELFLYLLYKCKDKKVMKKQAAEDLVLTRTSITRASEQLAAMGLIRQEMVGKGNWMQLASEGLNAFQKAKPFLINPVQKRMVVQVFDTMFEWPLSGESALGEKTMLNKTAMPCIAIDKNNPIVNGFKSVDAGWETDKECVEVELWKYNPMLFQKDGLADPVSLFMTLRENVDERVEASIMEYMEEYEW